MTASGPDRGRPPGPTRAGTARAAGRVGGADRALPPGSPRGGSSRPASRPRPAEPFANHRSSGDGHAGPGHRQRGQDRSRRCQRQVSRADLGAVSGHEHRDHTADLRQRAVRPLDPGPQPRGGVQGRAAGQAVAGRPGGPSTRPARQADQPRGPGDRPAAHPPGIHGHRSAGAAGPRVPAKPRRGTAVTVQSGAPPARAAVQGGPGQLSPKRRKWQWPPAPFRAGPS